AKFYVSDEVDIGRFVNTNLHGIEGIDRTLTTLTFKAF
ncbi:MAG: Lrp/AsnC family transcriptional regulator, partial [Pseudomonadota bacterium]